MQPMPIAQLREQLPEFLARIRSETNVPGISVAISVSGQRIYACAGTRAAGEPAALTIDERFHLGCVTKLLLAVVALELTRSGRLDLNAPIGEYLSELAGNVHGRTVCVAHLLSHTSGYRGTNILEPRTRALAWPAFVDYLHNAPQFFVPGSVFSYEHTEAILLGEIVRRITGQRCLTLIRELVFQSLGIEPGMLDAHGSDARFAGRHDFDAASGSFKPIQRSPPPGDFWFAAFSSFTLSPVDLLTIAESAIGVGSAGAQPISDATRTLLQRPVVRLPAAAGGPLRELLPVAFGLGAAQMRDDFHGNNGLTHGQCLGLRFDPHTTSSVAVGLNAMAPHLRDFILAAVCSDLAGRPVSHEPKPFELELAELEGFYRGPGNSAVAAKLDRERLICEIGQEGSPRKLSVDVVLDDRRALALRSPVPQLSLGFFREPDRCNVGMMIGLNAYKRVDARGGKRSEP